MGAAWTEKEASHLLRRAAFSASRQEVDAAIGLGMEETVRRLVSGESLTGRDGSLTPFEELKADGKNLAVDQIVDHQTYWIYRMAATESPLLEKMTLFWHDHFATSYAKVKEVPLMLKQNELLRTHALGSFKTLVEEIGKDPAMMIWLDTNSNKKGKPNENYAREVMELFTLGIGNYTEDDVKEAARSFTGWVYDRKDGQVKFTPKQHDTQKKTLLGKTGNWDESDVVDILFTQDATFTYVARKLLNYFASSEPSDEWVVQVASDLRSTDNLSEVMYQVFTSDEFYENRNRLSLVKNPTEYIAGIVRALKLPMAKGYASASRKMGQELYLPPDVAGWKDGDSWLMSTWLLSRYQFAESIAKKYNVNQLTNKEYRPANTSSGSEWAIHLSKIFGIAEIGERSEAVLTQYAEDTFIHSNSKTAGLRGLLQLMLISPEAQMK